MEAVYAYCRAMDDVVDREEAVPAEAREEMERWRRELRACAQGHPTHPVTVALAEVSRRFSIPAEYFERLIAGVEMDLGPRRYETFEDLRVYCERVASAVGLISVRVFGCAGPAADEYAVSLGIALQLTNILRDLKADGERGRVYLPQQDLSRFGVTEADLLNLELSDAFRQLMVFECARAHDYFRRASEAFQRSGEGRKLLPARIMAAVYFRVLQEIEERDYDVFSEKIRLSRWQQLSIAAPFVLTTGSG